MTPKDLMVQAIAIAKEGYEVTGELPIGAVVAAGFSWCTVTAHLTGG